MSLSPAYKSVPATLTAQGTGEGACGITEGSTGNLKTQYTNPSRNLSGNIISGTGKPTLLSFVKTYTSTDTYSDLTTTNRVDDGSLTQGTLDSLTLKPAEGVVATNLISIIPIKPTNSTGKIQFDIDMKILQENIWNEYNYYNCRYAYCLNRLLTEISASTASSRNTDNITKYLTPTVKFNTNINDLLQIIDKINTYMMKEYQSNENLLTDESLVSGDPSIEKLIAKFQQQRGILSGENATTKLRKEMVKYTEEKARYTDNLLKMYSVLNIVALSLLVYVYKSAG